MVTVGHRPGRKAATTVFGLLAGGDCIDDVDVLRAGATGRVLDVMAPSTVGTWLRSFTFGHVRQLDRVAETLLGRVGRWRRAGRRAADDRRGLNDL